MVLFSLLMVLICLNACSGAKTSDNVTVYVTTNDRAKDFVRSEIALGDKQAASPSVITTLTRLNEMFRAGEVKKTYWAVVWKISCQWNQN